MVKSNDFVPSSTFKMMSFWNRMQFPCKKFIRLNFKKLVYLLSSHCHKNNLCINSFWVDISESKCMESIKELYLCCCCWLFVCCWCEVVVGWRCCQCGVWCIVQPGLNNNGPAQPSPAQPSPAQTAFNKLRTKLYSCKLGTSKDIRVNLCFSQRQPTFRELWQRQM